MIPAIAVPTESAPGAISVDRQRGMRPWRWTGPGDRLLAHPARQLDPAVVGDRRAVDGDVGGVARGAARRRPSGASGAEALDGPVRRRSSDAPRRRSGDLDRHAGDGGGERAARRCRSAGVAASDPHEDAGDRPVAQHVALRRQARCGRCSTPKRSCHHRRYDASASPGAGAGSVRRNVHEAGDVARPAGLGAAADRRALPAAERLAAHDGAGRVAVDVGVADLDPLQPVRRSRPRRGCAARRSARRRRRSGCAARGRGRRRG